MTGLNLLNRKAFVENGVKMNAAAYKKAAYAWDLIMYKGAGCGSFKYFSKPYFNYLRLYNYIKLLH